jgi:hypothetical protein
MPSPTLIGRYPVPAVRKGKRVTCLFRDGEAVITGVQDAPIPWPRCRRVGTRGGSGLWVNETLVRAIRTESSLALQHHFGVSAETVWRWRKSFGVRRLGTPGSEALHAELSARGTAGIKAKTWTDAERDAKSERSKRLGLKPPGRPRWTKAGDAILGTMNDKAAAYLLGTSRSAARSRRGRLHIPPFSGE